MNKREGLLVLAVYIVLTLLMTYPVVARLGSHFVGTGSDMWVFQWNDWWLRKCLLEERNPFYTNWMFYPEGVSLVYHNFAWLNTLIWLPLSALVGSIVAYNLIFILNLALGGVGMYALARYLVGNRWAASLAGLIFAFWPFRLIHFNHPNMISTEWIPLFLLYLIRTVREERKWRDGVLAGIFLGLTGLSRWLHLALAAGLAALYVGYSLPFERRRWGLRAFAALAMAGLIALLILAPFGAPLAAAQMRGGSQAEDAYLETPDKGTDLLGYLVPVRGHPAFQRWLWSLWSHMGQESYIGYVALTLAIYGGLRARRQAILWSVMAGLIVVFSLGVELQVAGHDYQLPLPYRLVQSSFVGGLLREPRRLSIVLGLPVAVLASYGTDGLLKLLIRRWGNRTNWATLLIGALVLFEYALWPFPTVQPHVSPFYRELAAEEGDFGLLDLPMGTGTPDKFYMYYATIHGKSLVEGHVSRVPGDAYRFIDGLPLTYSLRRGNEIPAELGDVSRQLRALADVGVRYLILHKDLAKAEQVAGWRKWLAVASVYEDDQIVVYNTSLRSGRDFQIAGDIGDGVGVVGVALSTNTVAQDGLLEATVIWGTRRPPARDWTAYLALVGPTGQDIQRVTFEPCTGWPTSEWGQDEVARGRGVLQVDPFAEGGTYTAIVGLVDPVTGVDAGKPLPAGRVEVQVVERAFAAPEPEFRSGAVFGADLRLLGYDLRQADEQLSVVLHWRALRRMDTRYKFFIHLCDVENGEVVTQADVMPRQWTYPTTWWEVGEVVSDEIPLSLSNVPPGRYQLMVGVYDPDTGERLAIESQGGDFAVGNDRLILSEISRE